MWKLSFAVYYKQKFVILHYKMDIMKRSIWFYSKGSDCRASHINIWINTCLTFNVPQIIMCTKRQKKHHFGFILLYNSFFKSLQTVEDYWALNLKCFKNGFKNTQPTAMAELYKNCQKSSGRALLLWWDLHLDTRTWEKELKIFNKIIKRKEKRKWIVRWPNLWMTPNYVN